MCGGGKTPELPATPAPTPQPMPSDVAPQQTESQRAAKIAKLRMGVYSTIKTSPQGAIGTGPELSTTTTGAQKKTLGS